MKSAIESLLNGNLAEAKAMAKRYSLSDLARTAFECGLSRNQAFMAASFLKGRCTFQAYCDA